MAFFDLMIDQLFAEIRARPELSQRDRRLVTMGVIAALGDPELFGVQVRASLKNGELTPSQIREMIIHLTQYAGYPRASRLHTSVEPILSEFTETKTSG
jgi:4-carboxymuconolactone decarboxylase